MAYPKSVVLEGDILEDFLQMSEFFEAMDRWEGHKDSYLLTAKRLFDEDESAWKLFLDMFFPETVSKLRKLNNGTFSFVPVFSYNNEGRFRLTPSHYNMESVDALFDYLVIPKDIRDQVFDYVKNLHFHYQGKPAPPSPRLPVVKLPVMVRSNTNDWESNRNENETPQSESNENEIELGFKNEEEEEAFGKLKLSNYRRFAPKGGKRTTLRKRRV